MARAKSPFEKFDGFKGFRRIRRINNPFGRKRKVTVPTMDEIRDEAFSSPLTDTEQQFAYILGNVVLARRVAKLKSKYPDGSLPELVVMDWLDSRSVDYDYQVNVFGGRARKGGQVLDFIVSAGIGRVWAWRVQGFYYHSQAPRSDLDAFQKASLKGASLNGRTIQEVVDLEEAHLLSDNLRDSTLQWAMAGLEAS